MDVSTISSQVELYALILLPIIIGLTQLAKTFLGEQLSGKWAPVISLTLGVGGSLLFVGVTRQAAVIGVILGLMAAGLYSGGKAMITKASGSGGFCRLPVLIALAVLSLFAFGLIGCGAGGSAVQLTPDEQISIQITTQEQAFMTLYRSARAYVLAKPEYQQQWNEVIQPAFSASHQLLAQYELDMMGHRISVAEMELLVNDLLLKLTQLMVDIGWVQ